MPPINKRPVYSLQPDGSIYQFESCSAASRYYNLDSRTAYRSAKRGFKGYRTKCQEERCVKFFFTLDDALSFGGEFRGVIEGSVPAAKKTSEKRAKLIALANLIKQAQNKSRS